MGAGTVSRTATRFPVALGQAHAACAVLALAALCSAQSDESALRAVRAEQARRVAVFERITPAVVCIFGDRKASGGGSGVLIDERGYGLTNFHVVREFVETRHGFGGLSDGKLYPLELLGIDRGGDLAMFKLDGAASFPHVELGDSDALRVGQWVCALGNPFLLAEDYSPTITVGIISGLRRYQEGQGNLLEYADCIQVSTSINPGNSGGPLFDMRGRLLGINGRASFEERGRVNVGLGYAISINQIKRFIPALRSGHLTLHGTLGATVRRAGDALIIGAIQQLSPAERAGLQLGDELLSIGGRRCRTPNDFNNILATMPANWPLAIRVRRDASELSVQTRLEALSLRRPLIYLLDLEHNHSELRGLLARAQSAERTRLTRKDVIATWSGSAMPAGKRRTMRIEAGPFDQAVHARVSSEAHDALLDAVGREWSELIQPLLITPVLDVNWELIGGDEIDGHIVEVVEHRLDQDQRVQWCFDTLTGELVRVRFTDADRAVSAEWAPGRRGDFDAGRWPRRWVRRAADGTTTFDFGVTNYQIRNPAVRDESSGDGTSSGGVR